MLSICLYCLLIPAVVASSVRNHRFLKDDDFPKVYTAIVPAVASSSEINDLDFVAEVDILDIIEVKNEKGMESKALKISFLVHDAFELQYLKYLTNRKSFLRGETISAINMEIDPILSNDLHDELNYEEPYQLRKKQRFSTIDGYSCYKDVAGTFDWMQAMEERAMSIPGLSVTVKDIGDSFLKTEGGNDGYDMMAMVITGNGGAVNTEKSVFFAMTGIHAREYAPPELVSRWAEEDLIEKYGRDADITAMLDHTEIHLVIQSNPDGRVIAETQRWQYRRKNANTEGRFLPCLLSTRGVDLNRNFPFKWDVPGGSSTNRCSQTYRGPAPGSEPEVQAILKYCEEIFPSAQRKLDPVGQKEEPYPKDAMGVFFDIHSYGELILWPWSHQNEKSGNDKDLFALANKYKGFNGYTYAGPQQSGWLYEASGTTVDWAYGTLGAAAITFEIGTSFYQRCDYFEDSILASNKKALTYAAKISRAPYSIPQGPDIIDASIVVQPNGYLSVNVTASDSKFSADNHSTSQQGVAEILAFINTHPYDMLESDENYRGALIGNSENSNASLDVSNLPDGKHVIYLLAVDSENNQGAVSAYSFNL